MLQLLLQAALPLLLLLQGRVAALFLLREGIQRLAEGGQRVLVFRQLPANAVELREASPQGLHGLLRDAVAGQLLPENLRQRLPLLLLLRGLGPAVGQQHAALHKEKHRQQQTQKYQKRGRQRQGAKRCREAAALIKALDAQHSGKVPGAGNRRQHHEEQEKDAPGKGREGQILPGCFSAPFVVLHLLIEPLRLFSFCRKRTALGEARLPQHRFLLGRLLQQLLLPGLPVLQLAPGTVLQRREVIQLIFILRRGDFALEILDLSRQRRIAPGRIRHPLRIELLLLGIQIPERLHRIQAGVARGLDALEVAPQLPHHFPPRGAFQLPDGYGVNVGGLGDAVQGLLQEGLRIRNCRFRFLLQNGRGRRHFPEIPSEDIPLSPEGEAQLAPEIRRLPGGVALPQVVPGRDAGLSVDAEEHAAEEAVEGALAGLVVAVDHIQPRGEVHGEIPEFAEAVNFQ